jgi:sensor histidine kinase regulating citrate/malate metabolism
MAVEGDGHISLINTTARKLLDAPQMHNLKEIQAKDAKLYELLSNMKPGDKITQRYQNKFFIASCYFNKVTGQRFIIDSLSGYSI